MEKENIIMEYIAVWNWHITGIIFLVGAFVIAFSGISIGNNIMFVVFLVMWAFCDVMALKRKAKLETQDLIEKPVEEEGE